MKLSLLLVFGVTLGGCSYQAPLSEPIAQGSPTNAGLKQTEDANGLYPARVGDKYGYIDSAGKMVIQPRFDLASGFKEGLAQVQTNWDPDHMTYEFIDRAGKVVLSDVSLPTGDHSFSEGLLPFEDGKKTGYMDRTGKVVIKPRFYCEIPKDSCGCSCEDGPVGDFHNGFASVMEGGEPFLIDKQGQRVFDAGTGPFSEGLASAQIGGKVGFIDVAGKTVIAPRYATAGEFREGLCPVQLERDENKEPDYIYIDKSGKQAFPGHFTSALNFREGLAIVNAGQGLAILNRDGQVTPIKEGATMSIIGTDGFHNGLLRAVIETSRTKVTENSESRWSDSQAVFVNTEGKIAVRFQASDLSRKLFGQRIESDFDGHLAYIYTQDKGGVSGYVDRTGKFVWKDVPSKSN